MKSPIVFSLLAAASLASCATFARVNTPSGMPEVTLAGVSQADALDAVVKQCVARNFNVASQTTSSVVCSFEATIPMQLMVGTYGGTPHQMIQFVSYKEGTGTKLISNRVWEAAPNRYGGAVNTNASVPMGKMGQDLQAMLEQIKTSFGQ